MKYLFWVASVITLVFSGSLLRAQQPGANATSDALPEAPPFASTETVDSKRSANSDHYLEMTCSSDDLCNAKLNFDEKVRYFAHHSFGPGAFVSPLFTAGAEIAKPPAHYPKQWRQGAAAFGRLYGDALAFQMAAQTGRLLTGAALHEDPRYSSSTSRNPLARTMHAVVFTLFDKSDSGRTTLALSNVAGAASAGFIGNAYLPHGYNDTSHAGTRTGIALGSFAVTNLAVEFSPELRRIGRGLHLQKFLLSGQPEKMN
jgi:hypothetical protein